VGTTVAINVDDSSWMQDGQYILVGNEVDALFVGGLFRIEDNGGLYITATLIAYDRNSAEATVIPVASRIVISARPDQQDLAEQYAIAAAASAASIKADTIQNGTRLTGYVGGGSLNLDGLDTDNGDQADDAVIQMAINGFPQLFKLSTTPPAASVSAPITCVQPVDYHATTNARRWVLLGY